MSSNPTFGNYIKQIPCMVGDGKYTWEKLVSENSRVNPDLTSYATEEWVLDGYQPKGNYLTMVPLATTEKLGYVNPTIARVEVWLSGGNRIALVSEGTTGCPSGIAEMATVAGDSNAVVNNIIHGARIAAMQKIGANSKFGNNYEFA